MYTATPAASELSLSLSRSPTLGIIIIVIIIIYIITNGYTYMQQSLQSRSIPKSER